MYKPLLMCAVAWTAINVFASRAMAAGCEPLTRLSVPNAQVTSARVIPPGTLSVGGSGPMAAVTNAALAGLPEFCRVTAVSRPSPDSDIRMEIWLPTSGWNGKLQSVGNGAWAGSISYRGLAGALVAGYAAASTDTGHMGNSVDFAVGHPERLVDFAHRAVHEMTLVAKAVVVDHYARPAAYSYFAGCSTGGRQALAEVQRYPEDYDGIIAGAPAHHATHLQGMQVWTAVTTHRATGSALDRGDLAFVNRAALVACDALDGVEDGVIEDPRQCSFDPETLVCRGGSGGQCLTPLQAETVSMIYSGPTDSKGGPLFYGLQRGSELGWSTLSGDAPLSLANDLYAQLVFEDEDWDYRTFEAGRDIPYAVERIGPLMNSVDADLTRFASLGGKLLLYHGWNDPGIPAGSTVSYYESVVDVTGRELAAQSVRLFMVPGMNHCGGGVGTDRFDAMAALDLWVRTGQAPALIEAARMEDGRVVRTRPLCPYPEVATYVGEGSTDDSQNFYCR
jgi:feruloyl esterase